MRKTIPMLLLALALAAGTVEPVNANRSVVIEDETYPSNGLYRTIDNDLYYFNKYGYMQTGWQYMELLFRIEWSDADRLAAY